MLKDFCQLNSGEEAHKIIEKFNKKPIKYIDIKTNNIKDKRIKQQKELEEKWQKKLSK